MIDPDQLMKDMAEAIVEDGIYPEEYINDNGIMAKKIDSYVHHAEDDGYFQHDVWQVFQEREPFYFIYEWNTYPHYPPALHIASPYEVTRFTCDSDDFCEIYRENKID